jgi:hypothetical protein
VVNRPPVKLFNSERAGDGDAVSCVVMSCAVWPYPAGPDTQDRAGVAQVHYSYFHRCFTGAKLLHM